MLAIVVVNDTATTEIYTYCHTLSLHDALSSSVRSVGGATSSPAAAVALAMRSPRLLIRSPLVPAPATASLGFCVLLCGGSGGLRRDGGLEGDRKSVV